MNSLAIMTCGSVDDGKSTLLGRLLFETQNIYTDQKHYLEKIGNSEDEFDFSLLLDGLIDEREQGITIDIAFKYFVLGNTQVTLIDSPGHIEFTKNMANAATFSDLALILIDGSKGLTQQTKRHLEIINLFPNIYKKIVVINKMDLVEFSEEYYDNLKNQLKNLTSEKKIIIDEIIPISAKNGDNITSKSAKTSYYKGPTLIEAISNIEKIEKENTYRYSIVKFVEKSKEGRIYYLENTNKISVGDKLQNVYTGETSKVEKIYANFSKNHLESFSKNIAIKLSDEISINTGDNLVLDGSKYINSSSFKSKVIWTGDEKVLKGKRYLFCFHSKQVYGFVSKIEEKDFSKNMVSTIQVELEDEVNIDTYKNNYFLSQLVIADSSLNRSVGFGYITQHLDKGSHVKFQKIQDYRDSVYKKCIWLTGLPSSGKSTIASEVKTQLETFGIYSYILDGDNLRSTINKDLGFTDEDRIENNRRISHISKILFNSGVVPIVATISPNKSSRDFARSLYDKNDFILVHVDASIEECIKRDPKGLYSSKTKKIKNITGINSPYDVPINPDIHIDTESLNVDEAVTKIIEFLKKDIKFDGNYKL